MYDVCVSDLVLSSFGSLSLSVLIGVQIISFLILFVVSLKFNKLVHARAQFFSAMDLSEKSYGVRSKQLLLLSYILTIVTATVIFDLLFFIRPHIL